MPDTRSKLGVNVSFEIGFQHNQHPEKLWRLVCRQTGKFPRSNFFQDETEARKFASGVLAKGGEVYSLTVYHGGEVLLF